jgi:hypothetical protein
MEKSYFVDYGKYFPEKEREYMNTELRNFITQALKEMVACYESSNYSYMVNKLCPKLVL